MAVVVIRTHRDAAGNTYVKLLDRHYSDIRSSVVRKQYNNRRQSHQWMYGIRSMGHHQPYVQLQNPE